MDKMERFRAEIEAERARHRPSLLRRFIAGAAELAVAAAFYGFWGYVLWKTAPP